MSNANALHRHRHKVAFNADRGMGVLPLTRLLPLGLEYMRLGSFDPLH